MYTVALENLGHGNVYGILFVGMHGVALEVTYIPKGGSKMNGPKFFRGAGKDRVGIHNHIHDNPVNALDNSDLKAVVAKDATLLQDRSMTRANFQGRFRKTTFGDFKSRPGRADEVSEASQEDYVFNQAKEEAALAAAAVTEAAAADGVIIEPSNG